MVRNSVSSPWTTSMAPPNAPIPLLHTDTTVEEWPFRATLKRQ
jgi:hypothetical protein